MANPRADGSDEEEEDNNVGTVPLYTTANAEEMARRKQVKAKTAGTPKATTAPQSTGGLFANFAFAAPAPPPTGSLSLLSSDR